MRDTLRTGRAQAQRITFTDEAAALVLCGLLTLYALVALSHLQGWAWNFDEGIAVQQGWLLRDGYRLYEEVWTDHTPGHPILVSLAFRLGGVSIQGARAVSVWFALVGLFAVAWAARQLVLAWGGGARAAWAGGLAAATLLALAPNFWWASRAAMMGIPAFSLGALALALALTYARTRDRRWLAGAALALGLSLWFKLQLVYLGPLLGLLVLWVNWGGSVAKRDPSPVPSPTKGGGPEGSQAPLSPPSPRIRGEQEGGLGAGGLGPRLRSTALDLALLAVALGPLVLSVLFFPPRAFFEQAFGTYLLTRTAYQPDLTGNLAELRVWLLADNWGLIGLALVGAFALLVRPSAAGVTALAWFALTLLTPLQHAPLYLEDHFQPLLFALVMLAGTAVGVGVSHLSVMLSGAKHPSTTPLGPPVDGGMKGGSGTLRSAQSDKAHRPAKASTPFFLLVGTAVAVVLYLASLPHVLAVNASLLVARDYTNRGDIPPQDTETHAAHLAGKPVSGEAVETIRAHSQPDDFVMTDDQLVAFYAGRRVPPAMAAFSSRAVRIGAYDDDRLIEAAERSRAPIVMSMESRLRRFDNFMEWVDREFDYLGLLSDDRARAFVRQP